MNSTESTSQSPEDNPNTPEREHSAESPELLADQSAEIHKQIEKIQETLDSLPDSPEKEVLTDKLRRAMRSLYKQMWLIPTILVPYTAVSILGQVFEPQVDSARNRLYEALDINTSDDMAVYNSPPENPLEKKINLSHISPERKDELTKEQLPPEVPRYEYPQQESSDIDFTQDTTFRDIYTSLNMLLPKDDIPFQDFGDDSFLSFLEKHRIIQEYQNQSTINFFLLQKLYFNVSQILPRIPEDQRSEYLQNILPNDQYVSVSSQENPSDLSLVETPIQELYLTIQSYFEQNGLEYSPAFGDPHFLEYLHDNGLLTFDPTSKEWVIRYTKLDEVINDIRYLLPLWNEVGNMSEILWQMSHKLYDSESESPDLHRLTPISNLMHTTQTSLYNYEGAWENQKHSELAQEVSQLSQERLSTSSDNINIQFVESHYPALWERGLINLIEDLHASPLTRFQLEELQTLAEEQGFQIDIFYIPLNTDSQAKAVNRITKINDSRIQIHISLSDQGFTTWVNLNEINEGISAALDSITNNKETYGELITSSRELQVLTFVRDFTVTHGFFENRPNDPLTWKNLFDNLDSVTKQFNTDYQTMLNDKDFYNKNLSWLTENNGTDIAEQLTEEVFRKTSLPFQIIYDETTSQLKVIPDSDMSLLTPEQRETVLDLLDESEGLQQEQSLNPS